MKIKLKLILSLFFISFFANRISAMQLVQLPLTQVIDSSEYIIEGTVITVTSFMGSDSNIYTNNTIKISKILKGTGLNCGNVEVVSLGGSVSGMTETIPGNLQFVVGQKGIFMCIPTSRPSQTAPTENPVVLQIYANVQGVILYDSLNATTTKAHWYWYDLPNVDSLYSYFHALTGYTYTACTGGGEATVENAESNTINYSFANEVVTSGYLKFDVMVSTNNPSSDYFSMDVYVNYNSVTFQSFGITGGGITVTMASGFNGSPYGTPTITDASGSSFEVALTKVSGTALTAGSAPRKFFHVEMAIVSMACPAKAGLGIAYPSHANYYDDGSGLTAYNTGINDSYDQNTCSLTLTSFTPTTRDGGLNQIITITGTGFGATRGNVFFTNGNDGTLTAQADDFHYQCTGCGWTDTQIKLAVPGYCLEKGVPFPPNAGTGPIMVVDSSGESVTSTQSLTVPYSLADEKYRDSRPPAVTPYWLVYLRGFNSSNGITFMMNNADFGSVSFWERECIKEALRDWVCNTDINMSISSSYTTDTADPNDHINSISFSSHLDKGVIGLTTLTVQTPCDAGGGNVNIIRGDIDIQISSKYSFWYDPYRTNPCPSTYYDFRSAVEHEFGHAIGLLHTYNGISNMMWPYLNSGDILYLSANDIAGADNELTMGEATLTSGCSYNTMIPITTCPAGIKTEEQKSNLNVFPNPFADRINLNFNNSVNQIGTLIISDLEGKILFQNPYYSSNTQPDLNLSYLSPGIYLLKFSSKDGSYFIKIVKE